MSPRERQVLLLLAHGYTLREIGSRLCLSESTVKTHKANLCRDMGLPDTRTVRLVMSAVVRGMLVVLEDGRVVVR